MLTSIHSHGVYISASWCIYYKFNAIACMEAKTTTLLINAVRGVVVTGAFELLCRTYNYSLDVAYITCHEL